MCIRDSLCKLAECRVRPVHPEDQEPDTTTNNNSATVQFDDSAVTLDQEEEQDQEQGAEAGAVPEVKKSRSQIQTRSQKKATFLDNTRRDNVVESYYAKLEGVSVDSLMENVLAVEIPVKHHGRADVVAAKELEIENLSLIHI